MKRFFILIAVVISMMMLTACFTHVPRPVVIEKSSN